MEYWSRKRLEKATTNNYTVYIRCYLLKHRQVPRKETNFS